MISYGSGDIPRETVTTKYHILVLTLSPNYQSLKLKWLTVLDTTQMKKLRDQLSFLMQHSEECW